MKVTFLGTGSGSTKGSARFKSGILIESKGAKVVLDFGSGIHMRLEDLGVIPDAVFVTHLHIDHFSGIFDHLVRRKIDNISPLRVFTLKEFGRILEAVKNSNDIDAIVHESRFPNATIEDLEIYSIEACHKIPAVSYVVTDGRKSVIYTGDTAEPCEPILNEIPRADLVIHEASCLDDCKAWGHTSIKEALRYVEKPVLTHIPSQIEKGVQNLVGDKAIIARDGMSIDV
ncbi:MBL fold metallo-hydrolase [Metallosphaera tengchongensis]|uniref:MBL fold metallo-hydrolase n=1 Tax=Metallosphaera tengchongensis TaxID=1532350 RepID=A0A6N0NXW7_9CREN|nr:MBL fold metallo-hydrolase [Metallosphaera tengchongensis]QKQ99960.1 MBL fold metallo-hydrolase [Metallosphaera tengchongensis]